MKKQEFLQSLRKKLSTLPRRDVEERINFYAEAIDDRMEDGRSEAQAVSDIGSIEEIARQIIADTAITRTQSVGKSHPRRVGAWGIVLLVLSSPIWLSLAIAAFAVILSLHAVVLSLVISFWAVFASLIACAVGGTIASIVFVATGNGFIGGAMIAAALVCAGLAIFTFFGCKAATKGTLLLPKFIALGIKKLC